MANKRYDQFPAGTYDTSKIFLQADPTTGELEKVNLPATGGLFSTSNIINANNSGSNPQLLSQIVIPAADLDTTGSLFKSISFHQILSTTGSPTVQIDIGGGTILSLFGTVTGVGEIRLFVTRIDASNIRVIAWVLRNNSYSASTSTIVNTALATGNSLTISINQTAGGAATMYHLGHYVTQLT